MYLAVGAVLTLQENCYLVVGGLGLAKAARQQGMVETVNRTRCFVTTSTPGTSIRKKQH
jgi:hypothetical protein